jgi:serine/threonine-protein kinase RsbW
MLKYIDIESITQKMILDSTLKSVLAVEELVSPVIEKYAIPEVNYHYIWVALNEAVSNAIKHGNKFDTSKKVRFSIEIKDERYLCFTIQDEGAGFDPSKVTDPSIPFNIAEPNGRGVFLIKKLSDFVNYSKNGTCVEIGFDLYKN